MKTKHHERRRVSEHDKAAQSIAREELFEILGTLSSPLVICDELGRVRHANPSAIQFLEQRARSAWSDVTSLRLRLDDRETLSAMTLVDTSRRRGGSVKRGDTMEFFLNDIVIEGLELNEEISATIASLESGGFRVVLVEQQTQKRAAISRAFDSLAGVMGSINLFEEVEEVLPLFGSCMEDIFAGSACRIEIWGRDDRAPLGEWERGYRVASGASQGRVSSEGRASTILAKRKQDHVASVQALEVEPPFLWLQSRSGVAIWARMSSGVRCGLQIERREGQGFDAMEREAAQLFTHVMGFFIERLFKLDAGEPMAYLAPVLDQLEAAVALCDARRMIRGCNANFARAFGSTMEAMIGRDVVLGFDASVQGALRTAAARVLSGGEHLEGVLVNVPGYELEVSVRVLPLQGVSDNVGEQSSSQRGFMVLMQPSLASLSDAVDKIERAEHLLQVGQLASGVAHELKNPMTSILNYAEYLLQKYRDQFFEQRDSERLVRIIEGVERMDLFIRDLLLLARPDTEGLEMDEAVDLHRVIRQACYLCEVKIGQYGAEIVFALEAQAALVRGHESELTQVFVNLLSNAAAALQERGSVIKVWTRKDLDAGRLLCGVEDNGCGMDEETLRRIFEPFYTRRRHAGGSGLGLPLVRSIVERHGGTILVTSSPGEGTRVELAFPVTQQKKRDEAHNSSASTRDHDEVM